MDYFKVWIKGEEDSREVRGKSIETVTKRFFGSGAIHHYNHNPVDNPGYAVYTITKKDGHVVGRIFQSWD